MNFQKTNRIGQPGPGQNDKYTDGHFEIIVNKGGLVHSVTAQLIGPMGSNFGTEPDGTENDIILLPWGYDGAYHISRYHMFVDYVRQEEKSHTWNDAGVLRQQITVTASGYSSAGFEAQTEQVIGDNGTEYQDCSDMEAKNVLTMDKKLFYNHGMYETGGQATLDTDHDNSPTVRTLCLERTYARIIIQPVSYAVGNFGFSDVPLLTENIPNGFTVRRISPPQN